MEFFGPIIRTPRVVRRDSFVRRSSSIAPFMGSRRSFVSTFPRSRSSFGYRLSDVGRDGCVVTRHIETSPLYSPNFGFSTYSTSPVRSSFFRRGRSFSLEPTWWPLSTFDSWDSSFSPIRTRTSFSRVPSFPRLSRWDSFSKPYYTVAGSSSDGGELVMKRTSFHQSPVKTPLRSSSLTNQSASAEEKVVAESNVVTKTSAHKEAVGKKGEVQEKTSIYRLETPHGTQKTLDEAGEDEERASFFRFETPTMSDRNMNVFKRSDVDRWVAPNRREVASYCYKSSSSASHCGSLASLPPAPVRRISVVNKSTTENGPKSSVEVVELEKPKTIKSAVIETKIEREAFPDRSELFDDLRHRTLEAKNLLGRHRILLDRYLPVSLGPEPEVAFEIQNKYGELVERLPFIERRSKVEVQAEEKENKDEQVSEHVTVIKPYSPAQNTRSYRATYTYHVPSSFTPTISETRRRARDVLCRVKRDPFYFSFN